MFAELPISQGIPSKPLTLIDICTIVWRGKWMVLGITAIAVGLAIVYVVEAKNWYRADVLLKPVDSRSGQGMSGQLGSLDGLAGLAGLSLGSNASAEPIAVLSSREFTASFIKKQNLMPILFADQWDFSANQWRTDIKHPPDIRDGVRYFSKAIRNVIEDKKTNLVTMTVEWKDPELAAAWANMMVDEVNDLMRLRALAESERNVDYLKEQIATSNVVALQQSIGRVLENQLQKLMLAKANTEFAFKIIDHAEIPKLPSRPQRLLIILAALFLGGAISTVALLLRHIYKHR